MQDKAEFSFDVLSSKGSAVVTASGTYNETENEWSIDSLSLEIQPKEKKEAIHVQLK